MESRRNGVLLFRRQFVPWTAMTIPSSCVQWQSFFCCETVRFQFEVNFLLPPLKRRSDDATSATFLHIKMPPCLFVSKEVFPRKRNVCCSKNIMFVKTPLLKMELGVTSEIGPQKYEQRPDKWLWGVNPEIYCENLCLATSTPRWVRKEEELKSCKSLLFSQRGTWNNFVIYIQIGRNPITCFQKTAIH